MRQLIEQTEQVMNWIMQQRKLLTAETHDQDPDTAVDIAQQSTTACGKVSALKLSIS